MADEDPAPWLQAPWKHRISWLCCGVLPHPCHRTHSAYPSSGPGLYQPIVEGQRLHDGGIGLGAFLELLQRQLPIGILQEERWLKMAVCLPGQESQVHPQLVSIESLSLMASSEVRRQHYTDPALLTHLTQPLVPHLGTRERHGDRSGVDTIGVNLQTSAALGFHQSKRLHWLKSHSILLFPLILHNKRGSVPQPIISATWEAEAGGSGLQILGYAGSSRPGWGIYRP